MRIKPISEVTACVVDHGLFVPVARRLARDFAKVYYYSDSDRGYPTLRERCIGDGYAEIERVESLFDVKEECDLFVFPDIGYGGLQREFISQGYPVWGHHGADIYETSRGVYLSALKECGLPVPNHTVVKGMANLKALLYQRDDDAYVKVSHIRKDWETFHWVDRDTSGEELFCRALNLGPLREALTFYVFDPIDTEIEDGCDAWCINGQWPETIIHGMEAKDKAYCGTFQAFKDLPEEVRTVNEHFGPMLAKYGMTGPFSTEVRVTPEGESYFIDPTCRSGSPPVQAMCEMIANYGEIVWGGANGEMVEPEPQAKFGAQAMLTLSGQSAGHWNSVRFAPELDQWVKCSNCCLYREATILPNDPEKPDLDIGWLVAIGDTIEEVVANLKELADQLPDGVTCQYEAMADLLSEIHKAEDAGMEFTDQRVPDPEIVHEET